MTEEQLDLRAGAALILQQMRRQWHSLGSAVLAAIVWSGVRISIPVLIGVTIFPLSLIGVVFMLVGTLGFTPFFTSLVLARNATRAFARRERGSPVSARRLRGGVGILILLTAPITAHALQHEGYIKAMITIDPDDTDPLAGW